MTATLPQSHPQPDRLSADEIPVWLGAQPHLKPRIYIAGPMRGRPENNFPAFNAATARFRHAGWSVNSPVEIGEELFGNNPAVPGGEYIRADISIVVNRCDAMALLPGWEQSTGARCEVVVALTIGLLFYDAETMERIPPPSRVVCNGGYEKPAGAVDTLDSLRDEVTVWANATFGGPERQPGKIAHLAREVAELAKAPNDVEEMADVFILLSHISDSVDLVGAVRAKFDKNRRRQWGKEDAKGVIEHVAEGAE